MTTNTVIIKAIQKINPTAQLTIKGGDIDSIVWENGTSPISKSDIEAKIFQAETEIADAASKKVADKASADAKLKALGLTDDEIEAFRN